MRNGFEHTDGMLNLQSRGLCKLVRAIVAFCVDILDQTDVGCRTELEKITLQGPSSDHMRLVSGVSMIDRLHVVGFP